MQTSFFPKPLGRVLITGGGSGLGRSVAEAVAESGGTPAVIDRAVEEVETRYACRTADVSDRSRLAEAVAELASELGGIDAVVTAAGIDSCGRLEDVDADAWERVIAVNLLGTVSAVRAALPYIEQSHGRIVIVASSLALRALPEATAYCASKFGVLGFARALAAETSGRVGVTTLLPAGMRTGFFDDRPEKYRPAPDAQLNEPADVARAVVFALQQPPYCEIRELVVCPEQEPSWP